MIKSTAEQPMTVAPWIKDQADARAELRRLNVIHSDLLRWSEQTSQPVVRAIYVERLPEIERQIKGLKEFLRASRVREGLRA